MLFHTDEGVIDGWLKRLKHHCEFYDISQFYELGQRLGGGKFSDVFEARNHRTKVTYALKKIDKTKLNPKEKDFLRDEVQIVSLLSHPNVVEMREIYQNQRWMWIVMEQVHGGELFKYLQKNVLSEADIVEIMRQLIEGIGYLHECGVIHRDLKPENILIETYSEDQFRIKITDFGLSKLGTPTELTFDACGTPAYVAPEVLHKVGYRKEVDLWACGVILYTMISK